MKTDKLLNMLLEAIDYSFLQTDGSYDTTLTYPVIDKVKYIKRQINDNEVKEVNLEQEEVIDKACEYLDGLIELLNERGHGLKKERIISGFKQAMKGE